MSPQFGIGVYICPKCEQTKVIKYNTSDDITYITVPKPVKSEDQRLKYKFTICNWLASTNRSKVILYIKPDDFDPTGNIQKEIDELYGPGRVKYLGDLKSNKDGIPYIDDWFRRGIQDSETLYVSFINTDILLSSNWYFAIKQTFNALPDKKLVIINQRIDFDLEMHKMREMNLSTDLLHQTDKLVEGSRQTIHSPFGVDLFTFRLDKLPFDPNVIPPFIMGRYNWDNWLCGYLNENTDTLTFGLEPAVYHINHVRHSFDTKDPKVYINERLRFINYGYFGSNYDTVLSLIDGKIVGNSGTIAELPGM
ncbi:hypothetical protein TVAG_180120 [Trichomonas vaginalis G3]|uniref:Uncharacterized protein n=1 Tax=Trichomonas vaginalis (strain ATCC PRA-98 / G3) TaxID=412133 RepID=A2EE41_TRIV3|nr:hypothetical protein TVAGG3_0614600 [Trichomonas vaginalis G3]EAY09038.1 hypothetical protein TVAG_180120 [Trichomonas vaginalis G3]KAI5503448.1 hypothetical protein TVAGG3_0614600 [Trichomonas vaginalis G3]|eukprot:XP_001321261.1 hypothetical protein [Trichomonas vaginalis G3]